MPIFDTPITTDDNNLQKVMQQKLPFILYLYNRSDANVDSALNSVARDYVGKLLVVRMDVSQNQQVHARYQHPVLPALLTLKNGGLQSQGESIKPADVKAHADYVLGQGPKPKPSAPPSNGSQAQGKPTAVSDGSFARDVLQSKVPVLVDFWAPWCGPCRTVAPILDRLAQKYVGQVKIVKLNVDDNPRMMSQYQASSIPMLILFKDGKAVDRLVGAHPQPSIERLIEAGIKR
jgi:thioredoxin 1